MDPKPNPVNLGYDQQVKLNPVVAESAIDCQLLSGTSQDQLLDVIPRAVSSTFSKSPYMDISTNDRIQIVRDVFMGRTLPAAKRFIHFNWLFDGISLQEVTHLIRYNWTFCAECSDVSSWRQRDLLVPYAICNDNVSYEDFVDSATKAVQNYADMIDTRKIDLMDARHILPRALSTYYYADCDLQETEKFIKDRSSQEFQPLTDNIMAYQMAISVESKYILATDMFNLDSISPYYADMLPNYARTYKPRQKVVDKFGKEKFKDLDFAYEHERDYYDGAKGTKDIGKFLKNLQTELLAVRHDNRMQFREQYGYDISDLDA